MIILIAHDKNGITTFNKFVDPKHIIEFDDDLNEFEKLANNTYSKWYMDYDSTNATPEQEKWLEDYL